MLEKRLERKRKPKSVDRSGGPEAITLRPAQHERLDPYGDEYFFPEIKDGEDFVMSAGSALLECDFSAFDDKLKTVTPEKLEEMFQHVGELEKELPELDLETRRLVHACWRGARIARKMLGEVYTDSFNRKKRYLENKVVVDGRAVSKRKLSGTVGEAMCAEFAALSHDILRRVGVDSSVYGAAVSSHPDSENNAHAFVSLQGGKRIFDPTVSNTREHSWPPAILDAEEALTVEKLRWREGEDGKMIECTDIVTGDKRLYGSGIGWS